MLDCFEDTLANVWLREDWLEQGSNYVTRIKNKYVKRESSRIGKTIEYNQIEKQLSLIKPEKNRVESGQKLWPAKLWVMMTGIGAADQM